MSKLVTQSAAPEQQEHKRETRTAVQRIAGFAIVATAVAGLAVLVAAALYAQGHDNDKYSLKSPSGIAFSDFRGYEDWADVSSARTTEILKVIVANPTMINAYKAGVPGNGQPFHAAKRRLEGCQVVSRLALLSHILHLYGVLSSGFWWGRYSKNRVRRAHLY